MVCCPLKINYFTPGAGRGVASLASVYRNTCRTGRLSKPMKGRARGNESEAGRVRESYGGGV